MLPGAEILIGLSVIVLTVAYATLYRGRLRLYRSLAAERDAILTTASPAPTLRTLRPGMRLDDYIVQFDDAIDPKAFAALEDEVEALAGSERSYLPGHKKGGTVAYETLIRTAPTALRLYTSPALRDRVSDIVGAGVVPTPINDQSSLSLLIYERPGDHIDWHYDHNFYRGRHFTVLLPIVNRGRTPGSISSTRFQVRAASGDIREFATPPNALLIFEGAKVLHKATPLGPGERRIVLSMTYCTDPRASVLQGIARRIKDTAFFGPRALWT